MSDLRYPWALAMQVAENIVEALRPACERIEIAGSLRRRKPDVGDIEILYIPTLHEEPDPDDFFLTRSANLADGRIEGLIRAGILEKRKNINGSEIFGEKNKLMRHVASGIPADLFAATPDNWFNYLVCRTGPADLNQRIASAAIARGWHWNPYGKGFSRVVETKANTVTEIREMHSEAEVFSFVGMMYAKPEHRK